MKKIVARIRRLLLGYEFSRLSEIAEIAAQSQKAAKRLDAKVTRLEHLLTFAGRHPKALWLYANRTERMDANQPFFEEGRCDFHLDRYRFACDFVSEKDVADIACGTGYGIARLCEHGGARQLFGVDIDKDAIEYAADVYGRDGVEFICASAYTTTLDSECVDVVTSFETLEHLEDEHALLSEFARVLRPKGVLVISTPNLWPCETHPHHVREYDRESFRAALSAHFDVQDVYNQNSGGASEFNRGQPRGIVLTTDENSGSAECFIAVCRKA